MRSYERPLTEDLEHGIVEFFLRMNLAFGDSMDYDWDRKECHDMRRSENVLINDCLEEHVSSNLKEWVKDLALELQNEVFENGSSKFYETFFTESEISCENCVMYPRHQISVSKNDGVFVSFISHRFVVG